MSVEVNKFRSELNCVPKVNLIQNQSPVIQLSHAFPSKNAWLKDDSRIHPVLGGNKTRRLEFLLADIQAKQKEILTFGYEPSNHVLATAYFSSEFKIPCHFIIIKGPAGMSWEETQATAQKMKFIQKKATSIQVVKNQYQLFFHGSFLLFKKVKKIQIIAPGGSNALGVLGYVQATFELWDQIRRGDLPEPDTIFVPLGTGGTAVGIAIGLRLTQLKSKVMAVRISPEKYAQREQLLRLAKSVKKVLPSLLPSHIDLTNFQIIENAMGNGYGFPTPNGQLTMQQWLNLEGIRLDSIYSGKAAAAYREFVNHPKNNNEHHLFWQTFSEFRP